MSLILGFDTSSANCSAALFSGDDVIAACHEERGRGQSERLFPMLEETLEEGGSEWGALDAIAVGIGPGNFTGIRISVAAARGLALSLKVPAVGVSLLEAWAFGATGPRLSCLSARRNQVYVQGFDMAQDVAPQVHPLDDLPSGWNENNLMCHGPAREEVAAQLGAAFGPAPFAPASAIARIAATRWRETQSPPAPMYLRAADAAPARDAGPTILSGS